MIKQIVLLLLIAPAVMALDANSYSTLIATECKDDATCIALTKAFIMERSGAKEDFVSPTGCAGLLPICYPQASTLFAQVQDCCPKSHIAYMQSLGKTCTDQPLCSQDDRLIASKNLVVGIPLLLSSLHSSSDTLAQMVLLQEAGYMHTSSSPPLEQYIAANLVAHYEKKGLSHAAALRSAHGVFEKIERLSQWYLFYGGTFSDAYTSINRQSAFTEPVVAKQELPFIDVGVQGIYSRLPAVRADVKTYWSFVSVGIQQLFTDCTGHADIDACLSSTALQLSSSATSTVQQAVAPLVWKVQACHEENRVAAAIADCVYNGQSECMCPVVFEDVKNKEFAIQSVPEGMRLLTKESVHVDSYPLDMPPSILTFDDTGYTLTSGSIQLQGDISVPLRLVKRAASLELTTDQALPQCTRSRMRAFCVTSPQKIHNSLIRLEPVRNMQYGFALYIP